MHRVVLIGYYLVFFVIFLPFFWRVNRIDESRGIVARENKQKEKWKLNLTSTQSFHKARLLSENLRHLFIITIDSKVHNYNSNLYKLIGDLHDIVSLDDQLGLFICDNSVTFDRNISNIYKYFPVSKISIDARNKLPNFFNRENLLKLSFINCVKKAMTTTNKPIFYTIFNEDILPRKQFLQNLNYVIESKLNSRIESGEPVRQDRKWLFLHLLDTSQSYGLICDMESLAIILIIAIIGSTCFYYIFKYLDPQMSSGNACFNVCYGALFYVTLALYTSKPCLSELKRMYPSLHRVYVPPKPMHFSALTLQRWSMDLMEPILASVTCSDYMEFYRLLDSVSNSLEIPSYVVYPSLVYGKHQMA